MICKKCGAVLPDNAEFCGECGAKVEKKKASPAAFAKAKSEAKRYKIISVILAALCVVMGIGWAVTAHNPYDSINNYEKEAGQVERGGLELSGIYVVGEDSELPEGRYNIYPPEEESYMSVYIYENMKDAKQEYDDDYNSLAINHIYSLTRGYKLKAGQVVKINYDSAFFELITDGTEDVSQVEETSAAAETETGTDTDE